MLRYTSIPRLSGKLGISFTSLFPAPPPASTWTYQFNTTYGIKIGGRSAAGPATNKYERSTYSTETNATNTNTYHTALYTYGQGFGSTTKAYCFGGDTDTGGGGKSAAGDSYTYGTNTRANALGSLSAGRYWGFGISGTTQGYMVGGNATASPTAATELYTMSTETFAAGPSLTTAQIALRGGSSDVAAYVMGYTTANGKLIKKLTYSSNTAATLGATTVTAYVRDGATRINYALTHIYCINGNDGVTGNTAVVEKFAFATETSAATTSTSTATNDQYIQGSTTKIYAVAGYNTNYTTAAVGYTTATDTPAAVTGMNGIDINTLGTGT